MTRNKHKWLGNRRILVFAIAALLALLWPSYFPSKRRPTPFSKSDREPLTPDGPVLLAQTLPKAKPAAGKFLIAGRDLRDPNFFETVVLLIEYKREGALGLIINRPTEAKLSALLPQVEGLEEHDDTIYVGGPVERDAVLLLVRSGDKPEDSERVFGNVFVSTSRELLERLITDARDDQRFRAYSGYAGWAPTQLDAEMARGSWHVLRADAESVFDPAPLKVWQRLIRRTAVQFAGMHAPVAFH